MEASILRKSYDWVTDWLSVIIVTCVGSVVIAQVGSVSTIQRTKYEWVIIAMFAAIFVLWLLSKW
jgi:acetaldehyde dehydrogenase (acetylating)